jgi:putative transposase
MLARKGTQLSLARKHGWGGKRLGAGRKRKDGQGGTPGVPHRRRPGLDGRCPVGITLKVRREVWSLRGARCVRKLRGALEQGRERGAFRVVHFAILGNHLHLIVEAGDRAALSRGLGGLEVRLARAINSAMARSGPVFADRFHAHVLRTPSEVARARRYVLENFAIHQRRAGLPGGPEDALTSAAMTSCAVPARTWLLRIGWRRGLARARPTEPALFGDAG